jgi:hypothetical protein
VGTNSNCSRCGDKCGPGMVCCSGECVNLSGDTYNCGTCGHSCYSSGGFLDGKDDCCRGTCVNRQVDVTNCGICGNRCSDLKVCVQGKCVDDIPIM